MAKSPRPIDDDDDDTPRRKKPVRRDDDSDDEPAPKPKAKSSGGSKPPTPPKPPVKKKAPIDDDEDDRPIPKKKKAVIDDDDDDDDRPSKSNKKKKGGSLKIFLIVGGAIGLLLLLACGGGLYYIFSESSSPKGVFFVFQHDIAEQRWEKMWDKLDKESQANLDTPFMRSVHPGKTGKDLFLAYMKTTDGEFLAAAWMLTYLGKIDSVKENGNNAEVTLKSAMSTSTTVVKMVKENGNWKVKLMPNDDKQEKPPEKKETDPYTGVTILKPKFKFKLPDTQTEGSYLALSDDGKILALQHGSAMPRGTTKIYDLSGNQPREMGTINSKFFGALSPNGAYLIDKHGAVFDTKTFAEISPEWNDSAERYYFTNDDQVYGIDSNVGFNFSKEKASPLKVTGWSISKKAANDSFVLPDHRFTASLVTKNRSELWLLMPQNGGGYNLHCHALPGGKFLRSVPLKPKQGTLGEVRWMEASPDGKYVSVDFTPHIFDAATGTEVYKSNFFGQTGLDTLSLGGTKAIGSVGQPEDGTTGPRKDLQWVIYDWSQKKIVKGLAKSEMSGGFTSSAESGMAFNSKMLVLAVRTGDVLFFDLSPFK